MCKSTMECDVTKDGRFNYREIFSFLSNGKYIYIYIYTCLILLRQGSRLCGREDLHLEGANVTGLGIARVAGSSPLEEGEIFLSFRRTTETGTAAARCLVPCHAETHGSG